MRGSRGTPTSSHVIIPRAHSEAYARAIPGAVLRNMPRAAHGMHHERPDDVADEIICWLTVSDAAPAVRSGPRS